jgi:hypothetical protein
LDDRSDANPGDGVCADASSSCTLRGAIEEANAVTACTPLTISIKVTGTINLASALPDLSHPNLTIQGKGANLLDVHRDSLGNFRIFTIPAGKMVAISGLKVSNGDSGNDVGAGIYNAGTLTLTGCSITGNKTQIEGGGIFNDGILNLSDSSISNNQASKGGGIFNLDHLEVVNTTIADNKMSDGGSIHNRGVLTMMGSTISGNTVTGTAIATAGLWNLSRTATATATLTNCTISGNTGAGTKTGGGVDNSSEDKGATTNLINCTVTNNTILEKKDIVNTNAGGLYSGKFGNGNAKINLKNTVVVSNSNPQIRQDAGGAVASQGNNLLSDQSLNTLTGDLFSNTPLLAPLGNYGGPTQTHALLPGSPAIGAGDNSVTDAPLNSSTDQRGTGFARQVGSAVDIGAFESQGFTLALSGSGNNQTAFVNTAFANPLAVIITANMAGEPVNGGTVTFTPPANSASAIITGNPATIASGLATSGTVTANATAGGPYQVRANTTGATAAVNFSLTNNTCSPITLAPLPAATLGVSYNQTITIMVAPANGNYSFALAGGSTLPPGLALAANGALTGTPAQAGQFNFGAALEVHHAGGGAVEAGRAQRELPIQSCCDHER